MLPNYLQIKPLFKKVIREAALGVLSSPFCSRIFWRLTNEWCGLDDKHGRDVVLIAGGPSFTPELADFLIRNRSKFDVIAINFYCLNEKSEILVPDCYVLSDPVHLETGNGAIDKKNKVLFEYLDRFKVKVICPYGGMWERLCNVHLHFDDRELLLSKNIHPTKPRGYPSNTFFKAIAIALALGYRNIFLLGLDYNYPNKIFVDKANRLFLREEHHYGLVYSDCSSHFENVAHALNWWSFDYHFFSKLRSENIFNVTENSLIDFFSRISPGDFLDMLGGD